MLEEIHIKPGHHLVLRVPMDAGGDSLQHVAGDMARVIDGRLVVFLPDWLAQKMHLHEGCEVHIDTRWGRLNIARVN